MIKFFVRKRRGAAWVDMGLGKTVSMLTAISIVQRNFESFSVLIIGPKRVARKVWSDEVKKWEHLQHLRVVVIEGTPDERLAAIATPADIHTIGFGSFLWLVGLYVKKGGTIRKRNPWPWDWIVMDESSGFKNRDSERWKALYRVYRHSYRIHQLTASAAPNGLTDVWAQIFFLDQGARLGRSLKAFRDRWFQKGRYEFRYTPRGLWAEKRIAQLLKSITLTMRAEDYLELPPITYNNITVHMSDAQKRQYRVLAKKHWIELNEKRIVAYNSGVAFGKCLQAANGAVYSDSKGAWEYFFDGKTTALAELLDHNMGKPVMIIYSFKSDLERIKKIISKAPGGLKQFRKLKTKKDEDDWNAGKVTYLALHPASGGHGLNLQDGGETIIWFGLNPSLELYEQANARICGGLRRIGKNVVIHHIVTEDTCDVRVVDLLRDKEATQERLYDTLKADAETT